jgi:hypothetical protein
MASDCGIRTVGDLEPPGTRTARELAARKDVAGALGVPLDEVFVEATRGTTDTVLRARWIPPQ